MQRLRENQKVAVPIVEMRLTLDKKFRHTDFFVTVILQTKGVLK